MISSFEMQIWWSTNKIHISNFTEFERTWAVCYIIFPESWWIHFSRSSQRYKFEHIKTSKSRILVTSFSRLARWSDTTFISRSYFELDLTWDSLRDCAQQFVHEPCKEQSLMLIRETKYRKSALWMILWLIIN